MYNVIIEGTSYTIPKDEFPAVRMFLMANRIEFEVEELDEIVSCI